MDLEQLRYFISVAKHLNFSEAAKELYVTQPTVSNQVANLETQLGVKLFTRDKRAVHLTPAGKVFLIEAEYLLERASESIEKTQRAGNGKVGSLRIGFLAYILKEHLPSFIPRFQQHYPHIQLQLLQYTAEPLRKALLSGDIDIGFTLSVTLQETPKLIWETLFTDEVTVAIRSDHPLACKPNLKLSDLAGEPFLSLSRELSPLWYDFSIRACTARGVVPNIVSQPSLMETVLLLADSGLGVAITAQRLEKAYHFPNLRNFEFIGDDAHFDAVIAWNKVSPNPSIQLFLKELGFGSQLKVSG